MGEGERHQSGEKIAMTRSKIAIVSILVAASVGPPLLLNYLMNARLRDLNAQTQKKGELLAQLSENGLVGPMDWDR